MTATTNPNKALWEKGDFTQTAASMRESGETLVAKLGITGGLHVLGLGCGEGTTAVPAAQLGAEVRGVDNVEIVRRSLKAMADRDVEELLSLYAPDIEFLPLTGTHVGSGGYLGHGGVRDYFAEAEEVWDVVRPEPDAMQAVGDDVVVFGHCAIRGKASQLETREALAWVITVRGGKVVRHRVFRTSQEALEAAGLSE